MKRRYSLHCSQNNNLSTPITSEYSSIRDNFLNLRIKKQTQPNLDLQLAGVWLKSEKSTKLRDINTSLLSNKNQYTRPQSQCYIPEIQIENPISRRYDVSINYDDYCRDSPFPSVRKGNQTPSPQYQQQQVSLRNQYSQKQQLQKLMIKQKSVLSELDNLRDEISFLKIENDNLKIQLTHASKDQSYVQKLNEYQFDLQSKRAREFLMKQKHNFKEIYEFLYSDFNRDKVSLANETEELYEIISQLTKQLQDYSQLYQQEKDKIPDLLLQIQELKVENKLLHIKQFDLQEYRKNEIQELQLNNGQLNNQIKKLEQQLNEKNDDIFREKAKSNRIREKLKGFEKKYYNIDIDLLHQTNSFLRTKLELQKWKLSTYINDFQDQMTAKEFFNLEIIRNMDKEMEEKREIDYQLLDQILEDNILLNNKNKANDVDDKQFKAKRTDYEKQLKRQRKVMEGRF